METNKFLSSIKSLLEEQNNYSVTENGAIGYKTTNNALVDLNFKVSSMRKWTKEDKVDAFSKAIKENPIDSLAWLFYLGDIRNGLGERKSFIDLFDYVSNWNGMIASDLLKFIPEYSRWDYLWRVDYATIRDYRDKIVLRPEVTSIIEKQIMDDICNLKEGKPISLLAKWLPSENATSKKTKEYAKIIRESLALPAKNYRQLLSKLRAYIDVTERKMCNSEWNQIEYSKVPSKANMKYGNAFLRHDNERRNEYLTEVEAGKTKLNASVVFPYEVVAKYCSSVGRGYYRNLNKMEYDIDLELIWKNLKRDTKLGNVLPIIDGSGSMYDKYSNCSAMAVEIGWGLGLYLSEQNDGYFKDHVMAFGRDNFIMDLSKEGSLKDKIIKIAEISDCGNTDIGKVFRNILNAAQDNHLTQKDLPDTLIIISDMEFDGAVYTQSNREDYHMSYRNECKDFDIYKEEYARAGYKLPRLIFWNVDNRTGTIPMRENELGVLLVSGFSTNILKMLLSNQIDPAEALHETLHNGNYDKIIEVAKKYIEK